MHRFTRDDAGGLHVGDATLGRFNRTLAVQRVAQTVDNAAQQCFAGGHVHDGVGPLDGVAFLDVLVRTKDHDTDVVGFEVQRHAPDSTGEFDHLTGLHVVQAVHAGDPVTDAEHATNLCNFGFLPEVRNLLL